MTYGTCRKVISWITKSWTKITWICATSGFRSEVEDIWTILAYYAAYRIIPRRCYFLDFLTLEDRTDKCPETSARNCRYTLRNISEEHRSLNAAYFMLLYILIFHPWKYWNRDKYGLWQLVAGTWNRSANVTAAEFVKVVGKQNIH
jgi:hypothetical protein